MMCGELKGEMKELTYQKELRGAMDIGMLWLMSARGFKLLKFALSA